MLYGARRFIGGREGGDQAGKVMMVLVDALREEKIPDERSGAR